MAGDMILQAIAEIILNAPMRKKTWRRVRWITLLAILGIVIVLTVTR